MRFDHVFDVKGASKMLDAMLPEEVLEASSNPNPSPRPRPSPSLNPNPNSNPNPKPNQVLEASGLAGASGK